MASISYYLFHSSIRMSEHWIRQIEIYFLKFEITSHRYLNKIIDSSMRLQMIFYSATIVEQYFLWICSIPSADECF